MNLLIIAELGTTNTYIDDIYNILKDKIDCTINIDSFWTEDYDIVHFHWPEALFKWNDPTENEISKFEERLKYLKDNFTKIIFTRHNYKPHRAKSLLGIRLYDLVLSYCDSIIHLGNYSYNDYISNYPNRSQHHFIIPHQIYPLQDNLYTQCQARKELKIKKSAYVILVFGAIRNREEFEVINETFKSLTCKNKVLLVNRWPWHGFITIRDPINKFLNLLRNLYLKFSRNYVIMNKILNEKEVEIFFKAADIVLIHRKNSLNSGLLALAFTYGKLIVGPNGGNIGEILNSVKNPVFTDFSPPYIINAISEAILLDAKEIGKRNYEYGMINFNIELIVSKHIQAYYTTLKAL